MIGMYTNFGGIYYPHFIMFTLDSIVLQIWWKDNKWKKISKLVDVIEDYLKYTNYDVCKFNQPNLKLKEISSNHKLFKAISIEVCMWSIHVLDQIRLNICSSKNFIANSVKTCSHQTQDWEYDLQNWVSMHYVQISCLRDT